MKTIKELNGYWAIEKNALQKLSIIKSEDNESVPVENEENESLSAEIIDGIAIVAITGVLTKYDYGFGTSTLQLKNLINSLVANSQVSGIILWVDSPGGQVSGTFDAAEAVLNCPKPISAVVSDTCCSGAYWIASQCDSILANKTAQVGSIGVYEVIADTSKMYEQLGVTCKIVKAGARKGVGADGIAITDEDLIGEQQVINDIYSLFVSAVTNKRKITAPINDVANGDVFLCDRAIKLGLVDSIGDINDAFQGIKNMSKSDITNQITASAPISDTKAEVKTEPVAVVEPVAATVAPAIVETPQIEPAATVAPVVEKSPETAPVAVSALPEPVVTVDIDAAVKAAKLDGYADAQKDEKERFAAVLKACGNRNDLAVSEFLAGHDVGKAREAYVAQLEKEAKETISQASVSQGVQPVAIFGATPSSSDNFEQEWARNENGLQDKFAGIKENFIATREYEKKNNQKIV
jgi:signal peptide peptidase SppA